ncbi:MAG: membrane protein insertase YidC [Proteobacteria bacterium]|nr:MAG: membrane protein insertase YidC [Pseudomonadota bacterium]
MQDQNKGSFFDPKTIIAVVLVGVIWYGWQTYLHKKYPNYNKPKEVVSTSQGGQVPTNSATHPETTTTTTTTTSVDGKPSIPADVAKEIKFEDQNVSFTLTSRGMGLKNYTLNKYVDYDKKPILLGLSDTESLFELKLAGAAKPLDFDLKEESPGQYVGTAQVGDSTVVRTLTYNSENLSFTNKIVIEKPNEEILRGISLVIPEKVTVPQSTSFLFPSYQHQDFFVDHAGKTETINFSAAKENLTKSFAPAKIVSVSSQYFSAAIIDRSELLPETQLTSDHAGKTARAELTYKPNSTQSQVALEQVFYAGPKSIDILKSIDPLLPGVIDHGFFSFIARPLLYIMKAFYSWIGNWGLAIICLTLLVRFCVLPFAVMSAKSMKAMQKIQPQLVAVRERYKADPVAMNRETMALMKQNKANPLGGCLPMLLQIPVFFALYRVIGSSIELYHSPFYGWITDLSSHDKFYVLPIIMGVAMFLQTKLTPTTMDPAQAKIMAFLPLVFTLFMVQLPAGLTLYMCVSTLFGIIQQMIFLRDKNKVVATA